MEDFVFESHTAIISQELLLEKLASAGIEAEIPAPKEEETNLNGSKVLEENEKAFSIDAKRIYDFKKRLRDWNIIQEGAEEPSEPEDSL